MKEDREVSKISLEGKVKKLTRTLLNNPSNCMVEDIKVSIIMQMPELSDLLELLHGVAKDGENNSEEVYGLQRKIFHLIKNTENEKISKWNIPTGEEQGVFKVMTRSLTIE